LKNQFNIISDIHLLPFYFYRKSSVFEVCLPSRHEKKLW